MNESDYPTELVSHAFFGDKEMNVGDKETVEIVSKDDTHCQIRCVGKPKKGERGNYGTAVSQKYQQSMMPPSSPTVGL